MTALLESLARLTNNLKLKHKLILVYIAVVMMPVLVIGGGVTSHFRQQTLSRTIEQTTNNVEKIKSRMATMLRVPVGIANALLFDKGLEEMVNRRYASVLELTKAYLNYTDLRKYAQQYKEISGIRFYFDNPTLINNMELIPVDGKIASANWYRQAMASRRIGWFYIPDREDMPVHRLSLVRSISFSEYRTSGVLMIELNQDELNRMLAQEPFETLIFDEQGYVAAAKNPDFVGQTLEALDYPADFRAFGKGTLKADIKGTPSYIVVDELVPESSMNGLKIVSVFATESIVQDANRVRLIGLALILLVLLIALAFVYIVSLLTTKRLLRLSRQLNKLAMGNLNVVSRIDGNDEIGQLSRRFNYMVASINQLMNQIVETTDRNTKLEIAQREIKLKMMASQINPHFLFNTLEAIRMNAHLRGEKELANVVRLLGKLMRKNLEAGRERAPLKEEVDLVRSYLEIQKFRYEDRLEFELRVEPEAGDVLAPPLIIQPLVENAVVHGLENKEGGIKVEVRIAQGEGGIRVNVKDNGIGITPERLEQVKRMMTDPEERENGRIGLRNVHQRLLLCYGDDYGLAIASEYGEGTQVSFVIPAGKE